MKIEITTDGNEWNCTVSYVPYGKIDAVTMRQIAKALLDEADRIDGEEKEKHMFVKNSEICSICGKSIFATSGEHVDTVTSGKELTFAHGKCWDGIKGGME